MPEINCQETGTQFCDLMMVVLEYENQLQAMRELLTLRFDFFPEALFNHISLNDSYLTRGNIVNLLEENNRIVKDEEIRVMFSLYGHKDKMSYGSFLNYIYPFSPSVIKNISTCHAKKYLKPEQPLSQEVLALFILLIEKQIEFIHAFEEIKMEILPNLNRQSLKRLMKQVKKYTPHQIHGLQSDFVLTLQEFKNALKKQKGMNERKLVPLCRRLSMQKQSFIGLDQLEVWLKPWQKIRSDDSKFEVKKTLFDDIEDCLYTV